MHSSIKQTSLEKAMHFFLTKMIAGIAVVVALVALTELLRSALLDKTNLSDGTKALITSITEAIISVAGYPPGQPPLGFKSNER